MCGDFCMVEGTSYTFQPSHLMSMRDGKVALHGSEVTLGEMLPW